MRLLFKISKKQPCDTRLFFYEWIVIILYMRQHLFGNAFVSKSWKHVETFFEELKKAGSL